MSWKQSISIVAIIWAINGPDNYSSAIGIIVSVCFTGNRIKVYFSKREKIQTNSNSWPKMRKKLFSILKNVKQQSLFFFVNFVTFCSQVRRKL